MLASSGRRSPSRLHSRPAAVLTISGFFASSRRKPWPPCRASGQTAAMLHTGTHSATSNATQATPCVPASRSARASAT